MKQGDKPEGTKATVTISEITPYSLDKTIAWYEDKGYRLNWIRPRRWYEFWRWDLVAQLTKHI